MRETENGFAIAFERQSDAARLIDQYERQGRAFAEGYRERALERVRGMKREYPEKFGGVRLPDEPEPNDI